MTATPEQRHLWDVGMFGRALVLLTALAGLFVMHGLSDHGTAGHAFIDGLQVSSSMHSPSSITRMSDGMEAVGLAPMRPASSSSGEVDLCMAVLSVGLLLLSLVGVRQRLLTMDRAGRRTAQNQLRRARAPDRPDLILLSIQRC